MPRAEIEQYVKKIKELDRAALSKAEARLESLAKPPGSLGVLEEIVKKLAGISGDIFYNPDKRCVIIMSSDNGVYEEGVASAPQSVTLTQTMSFTKGITGVAAIAKQFNTDLVIVDVGINGDAVHPLIINKKIRKSTWNIAKGAAMTDEECVRAIITGIKTAEEAVGNGYKMLGVGEMGIANTTSSAAVLCALTDVPPSSAAGKGAGLTEEAYTHKIDVIKTAIRVNNPDRNDAVDVLTKVGGFDIAAMAGVYIGAAVMRVPAVIDGFISMVAALCAARIAPSAKDYMFASHASFEQGFSHAAKALDIRTYLSLDMRLGEGSGCPIMFGVIDAAAAMMRDMGTFESADIGGEYLQEMKKGDHFTV